MEAHDDVVAKEKEKKEGANLLAPPDHDYVVLEVKELMKYFTKEGEPSKELEEVSSRRCLHSIEVERAEKLRGLLDTGLHQLYGLWDEIGENQHVTRF